MYEDVSKKSAGKHMICDVKQIKNTRLLNNIEDITQLLDNICKKYDYHVLHVVKHEFSPHGISILYLLSESHISIHTFPEREYLALDIYTCRDYPNNKIYETIYQYLVKSFDAKMEIPFILDRYF
jgi:S-adenosylmethionine decarboxylase proenzyme